MLFSRLIYNSVVQANILLSTLSNYVTISLLLKSIIYIYRFSIKDDLMLLSCIWKYFSLCNFGNCFGWHLKRLICRWTSNRADKFRYDAQHQHLYETQHHRTLRIYCPWVGSRYFTGTVEPFDLLICGLMCMK